MTELPKTEQELNDLIAAKVQEKAEKEQVSKLVFVDNSEISKEKFELLKTRFNYKNMKKIEIYSLLLTFFIFFHFDIYKSTKMIYNKDATKRKFTPVARLVYEFTPKE